MTPSLPTAPQVYGVEQSAREGSPRHFRLQGGEVVQKAKRRGLSIRGIARELSIHRSTARKYMEAESPLLARARVPAGST